MGNAAKVGDDLAEFVAQSIYEIVSEDERRIVFNRVMRVLQAMPHYRPPKPPDIRPVEPMSDLQAKAFEKELAPWGAYKDMPVSDIPLWYLERLADPPGEFVLKIRAYLQNPTVQRLREDVTEMNGG